MVTKLTLAANVAIEPSASTAAADVSPARTWRDWLAALFAPAVLRYAVPALALLAVMVVAFVATRERREANLVAQNEPQATNSSRQSNSATATVNQAEQAATPAPNTTAADKVGTLNENANAAGNVQRRIDAMTETPEAEKQAGKEEEDAARKTPTFRDEPKPAEQSASDNAPGRQTGDRDEGTTVTQAQPPPVVASPAAKSPVDTEGSYDGMDAKKSAEAYEKNKTAAPPAGTSSGGILDGRGNREQTGTRPAPENRRESAGARRARSSNTQLSREAAGPETKDDSAGETRSAGGRQFRRQGGVWVDTAYNSSLSTVNVARGSEQYRALIADEPGIRAVADQLGGTLIVVWKKRAYRIH